MYEAVADRVCPCTMYEVRRWHLPVPMYEVRSTIYDLGNSRALREKIWVAPSLLRVRLMLISPLIKHPLFSQAYKKS